MASKGPWRHCSSLCQSHPRSGRIVGKQVVTSFLLLFTRNSFLSWIAIICFPVHLCGINRKRWISLPLVFCQAPPVSPFAFECLDFDEHLTILLLIKTCTKCHKVHGGVHFPGTTFTTNHREPIPSSAPESHDDSICQFTIIVTVNESCWQSLLTPLVRSPIYLARLKHAYGSHVIHLIQARTVRSRQQSCKRWYKKEPWDPKHEAPISRGQINAPAVRAQ